MKATDKIYSRRRFIARYAYAGVFLASAAAIFGCGATYSLAQAKPVSPPGGPDSASAAQDTVKPGAPASDMSAQQKNPCDDLTGVSAAEIEKRKKLAYVTKSPIEDSTCSNCALYMPPPEGKACGGCLLFKGPVRPEAYCAYWAPINN